MDKKTSLEIFKEYFDRQIIKAKVLIKDEGQNISPFITISRETGAGGIEYPEKLLHYLNSNIEYKFNKWSLFDKNILEMVISEHDLPKELEKYMPEKKLSDFQNVIEQFFGLHPSGHNLAGKISHTILHIADMGNVILVGRGSNIITSKLKNGIHIRLIESLENRVFKVQEHYKIDKISASKLIEKEDNNRKEYIKKYFNKDIANPHLYSLIINFDKVGVNESLNLIKDSLYKM